MGDEPAKATAKVTAAGPATVVVYPPEYWKHDTLKLYFTSAKDCSVDDAGAKKYKKKANAPLEYVKNLQTDLITLGYLSGKADGVYGGPTKRAVLRFQRHAARVYRMKRATKAKDDVKDADKFSHAADGICDKDTAVQVRKWIDSDWMLPVGRFPLKKLAGGGGRLREDAADSWDKLVTDVAGKGATLASPYGDTTRPLTVSGTSGSSLYSFHYCGRAVDVNQGFAGGKGQRYWVVREPVGTDVFWRIWCKTDKQDGTQGTKKAKGDIKVWTPNKDKKGNFIEYDNKEGYYLDLTAEIQGTGTWERIKAHADYVTNAKAREWWHFQFTTDKQETFLDELELTGTTEKELRAQAWKTDAQLDHKPG